MDTWDIVGSSHIQQKRGGSEGTGKTTTKESRRQTKKARLKYRALYPKKETTSRRKDTQRNAREERELRRTWPRDFWRAKRAKRRCSASLTAVKPNHDDIANCDRETATHHSPQTHILLSHSHTVNLSPEPSFSPRTPLSNSQAHERGKVSRRREQRARTGEGARGGAAQQHGTGPHCHLTFALSHFRASSSTYPSRSCVAAVQALSGQGVGVGEGKDKTGETSREERREA